MKPNGEEDNGGEDKEGSNSEVEDKDDEKEGEERENKMEMEEEMELTKFVSNGTPVNSREDVAVSIFVDVFPGQDEEKPSEGAAEVPDGGYGWVIVVGCFLSHMIIGGFERNDGVFFLEFQEKFKESAQVTSWPGALVSSLRLFLGPIACSLSKAFSERCTVMVGAFLLTLGQILNAFAPNFYFLFLSHSAVQGVGRGLMYAPSLLIISSYFSKHQGLAAGLGSAGVGVGTFFIVPLTQYLFDNFGYQGTFIILTGIAFNGVLVAMLYRPLSMHNLFSQKSRTKAVADKTKAHVAVADNTASKQLHRQSLSASEKEEMQVLTEAPEAKPTQPAQDGCIMSSLKICFPSERQQGKTKNSKKRLFHFGLLKDPPFLMFCISICLFTASFKAAFTFIPALARSKNLSVAEAALILSISGVFDTAGRIASGLIMDMNIFRPLRLLFYNSFMFAIATLSFIMPNLTEFRSLCIVCSLYGTLTGAYVSQKSVVLVDILGVENLSISFGLLIFFQAIGTCIGPPLSGALKDTFGGYDEAFYMGGGLMMCAGLLMVASNIFLKIKRRRKENITDFGE